MAVFAEALSLAPDMAEVHYNLGTTFAHAGRHDDAERAYRRALELRADYGDARFGLATLLLGLGRFEEGWRRYESRYEQTAFVHRRTREVLRCAQWQGEPLAGKTLLVWQEDGLGDMLQFSRYFAEFRARHAARVVFACQPALHRLMATVSGQRRALARTRRCIAGRPARRPRVERQPEASQRRAPLAAVACVADAALERAGCEFREPAERAGRGRGASAAGRPAVAAPGLGARRFRGYGRDRRATRSRGVRRHVHRASGRVARQALLGAAAESGRGLALDARPRRFAVVSGHGAAVPARARRKLDPDGRARAGGVCRAYRSGSRDGGRDGAGRLT
ncbi:TPR repeat protein [Medicago truncatula]|uniref:TPR repeat protein n=1 Tax=Medicago truncatula TaxID=3880 RepID=A0A072TE43_MEDTR|nr:TPR repeat protein [Medicago truncatula]